MAMKMPILGKLFNRQHKGQAPNSGDRSFDIDNILSKLTIEERVYVSNLITRDHLADIYKRIVVVYMLILTVLLLWPFDLVFLKEKNNVHWIGTSNGIEFPEKGQVLSDSCTENLCGRLLAGTGFSLEVWAVAQNDVQSGPARIVSYSLSPSLRNFTLGQSKEKLVMRLRTSKTDLNGIKPHLEVDYVFSSQEPQHIFVTYDFIEQNVYINGERRVRKEIPGGRLTNWDPSYYLVIGNEATGDRPWHGRIFLVAIYNRPLGEKEIHHNYLAGWLSESSSGLDNRRVSRGIVALYLFEESKGDRVSDSCGTHTPLNLHIPRVIPTYKKPYLDFSNISFTQNPNLFRDVILNILIFVPVGLLLHASLRIRYRSLLKTSAFVFTMGILFIFGIESLQHFSLTRHSSLLDVSSNLLGMGLGIAIDRTYATLLKSQRKFLQTKNL